MRRYSVIFVSVTVLLFWLSGLAATEAGLVTIGEFTEGMERHSGFLTFYFDKDSAKLWLQVDVTEKEFLYVDYLASGLGSNPLRLDRGRPGQSRVVRFERIGPRIVLIQSNLSFRATSQDKAEVLAVKDSFAESVLWGNEISAASEGSVLVDWTSFVVRDSPGIAHQLERAGQGQYTVDSSRSYISPSRTKAFPKNCEFEATLTFVTSKPGELVREVSPDPFSFSLRVHQSLVELPDEGFEVREFDPRMSAMSFSFSDYAAPLESSLIKRFILKHRLNKKDPAADVSEAVEPIVYYVERGAPEPIRSALVEGASWWAEAFDSAGFRDAFRVELLPESADPLDVRYNVIQWVHRSTRGWSYGSSIVDPRTGEIIKGHVTLGSLRVRQDRMIIEGVVSPARGVASACQMTVPVTFESIAQLDISQSPVNTALARIRQLSAHEVGHTLGFKHNFAASSFGRESVMDYPAPLIKFDESGKLDLSEAYDIGIGEWDKISVQFSYKQFADHESEVEGLDKIVRDSISSGMFLMSDDDSRPEGAAQPFSNLWDNGSNPVEELRHVLAVRKAALNDLSEKALADGEPVAELRRVLVPIYLFHRYQVDAAAKMIGGVNYRYAIKGDGQLVQEIIPGEEQSDALKVLLSAISPEVLVLPERLVGLLAPVPDDYSDRTRELLPARMAKIFDEQAAAELAADLVVSAILQHERASRLVQFNLRNKDYPSLKTVIDLLLEQTWYSAEEVRGVAAGMQQTVESVVLKRLIELGSHEKVSPAVRVVVNDTLRELVDVLSELAADEESEQGHIRWAEEEINRYLTRPYPATKSVESLQPPPGSPIGN